MISFNDPEFVDKMKKPCSLFVNNFGFLLFGVLTNAHKYAYGNFLSWG